MSRRMIPVYALLLLAACGDRLEEEPGIDSGIDAAVSEDAGTSEPDAAPADSGPSTEDDASTGEPDASSEPDAAASEPDAGSDAGTPDAGASCFIGVPCNPSKGCPGDDRCYGHEGNGFCAPWAPECGGFVKTRCASGLTCIRAGGSSLGYCADSHEQYCICRSADLHGFSTDGCV